MVSSSKGSHLSLFPMHAIAKFMDTNGYEFPDARRWVLTQVSIETDQELKMSPKFHESFNYIADILEGRFIPSQSTSAAISALIQTHDLGFSEKDLTLTLFTYLEPSQLAMLKPLVDQAFRSNPRYAIGLIVSLKSILSNLLASTLNLSDSEPNDLWVQSDVAQLALLLSLQDVLNHWSVR